MKRKSVAETGLTDHEWRILRYLDQRGPTDRRAMVVDLANPNGSKSKRHALYKPTSPARERWQSGISSSTV